MSAPWPPRDDEAYAAEAAAALTPEVVEKMMSVEALVFDCDGVLTDGHMLYGPEGEAMKAFYAPDGLGLVIARAGGLKLALLTGRDSKPAERRCRELKFHVLKTGRFDKQAALLEIAEELGVEPRAMVYVGDDLIDVPALDLVGVPICVPAACADVRDRCLHVTRAPGGAGAVREVAELVLKVQGRFTAALHKSGEKAWLPSTAAGGDDPA